MIHEITHITVGKKSDDLRSCGAIQKYILFFFLAPSNLQVSTRNYSLLWNKTIFLILMCKTPVSGNNASLPSARWSTSPAINFHFTVTLMDESINTVRCHVSSLSVFLFFYRHHPLSECCSKRQWKRVNLDVTDGALPPRALTWYSWCSSIWSPGWARGTGSPCTRWI